MQKFTVKTKCGFKSFDTVVKIYDKNGILFYCKENPIGLLHFNLPTGEYLTYNSLMPSKIREYKLPKLPKANNLKNLPKDFKIIFCDNPNKCSVDNQNHVIYFDNSFKKQPIPVIDYILFHELGHYLYSEQGNKSEINCDLFAMKKMLEIGYNPSQILWVQNGTLSDNKQTKERKETIKNKTINSFI